MGKVFAYELILGGGYLQSKHEGVNSSSPTLQIDAFAPLWFDGFSLGIGIAAFQTNLGKSTVLAEHFGMESRVDEKNVNVALFPTYLSAKYEYFFNKDFSMFIMGKGGISIADKRYYNGSETSVVNGEKYTSNDKLEVWGNSMYGGTLGVSIYKNYMISASFESVRIRNVNYNTSSYKDINTNATLASTAGRFLNYTYVNTMSVKLSYAFR